MKKRYSISEDDCKVCIVDFYDNAAKIAGYHVTKEQIGEFWIRFGPKASIDSDDFVFEIEDGFVVAEE